MLPPTPTQTPALGAVVRVAREVSGLSLPTVAERAGLSKSTLSRFERGQRVISADTLERVAQVIAAALTDRYAA